MVLDRKKIMAELKKAKDRMGKVRFLPKDSTTHLRILEFEDEDGCTVFSRKLVEHRKEGVFTGKGDVCREETFGKPCAFCQVNRIAEQEGERKPYNYRSQYLINGIDVDNQADKVSIWGVPFTIFELVAQCGMDDEWENVLEPKKGYAFTVTKEGAGKETEYGARPMKNPYPVTPALMKQVKDPFEVIDDPGLDAQLEILNMAKEDLFGDDIEELEDEKDQPNEESQEKESSEKEETSESEEVEVEVGTEKAGNVAKDLDTSEEEPLCHGKKKYFDEDSDCVDCPWITSCRNAIQFETEEPAKKKGKTKAQLQAEEDAEKENPEYRKFQGSNKSAPKRRGRPKGSTTKKVAKENGSSASSLAANVIGKGKKK